MLDSFVSFKNKMLDAFVNAWKNGLLHDNNTTIQPICLCHVFNKDL